VRPLVSGRHNRAKGTTQAESAPKKSSAAVKKRFGRQRKQRNSV